MHAHLAPYLEQNGEAMYVGGGFLVTILIVLLIIYLAKRV